MGNLRNTLFVLIPLLAYGATSKVSTVILGSLQAQAQPALPALSPLPASLPPNSIPLQIKPASPAPNDAVSKVVAAGLMNYLTDGQFHPELFISRAELASILVRSFGLAQRAAASQAGTVEVQDVSPSYWASKDIQTVLKTGIMKGYRGNMFFPNQKVTRAEALAIFAQAYGVFQFPDNTVEDILSQYPDAASIPAWARKSLATSLNAGFVNIDTQNNINPLQPMTRADMAYALSQYLASSNRTNTQTPAK